MAKNKISEYSSTSADNTDISNINIAEGCSPSNVNNAIRTLMAQLKDQQAGTSGDPFTVSGALTASGTLTSSGTIDITGGFKLDGSTGTANQVLVSAGSNTPTWSTLGTMASQNSTAVAITGGTITGITDLTVADGGTGASSITANSVILGNGTSALSGNLVAPSTSGNVLTSNGTTWTSAAIPTVTTITPTTGSAPYYGLRAWAVISRQTSPNAYVILSGAGISSVTYVDDDQATVNIATANQPANTNYGILVTASQITNVAQRYGTVIAKTTTSFTVRFSDDASTNPIDQFTVSIIY